MDLVGSPSPDFELHAAVSDRVVNPAAVAGRPTVLVLHGPRTTDAPKQVGKAVRAAHPNADEVFVANVVNLQSMGGLWRKVATAQLNSTYERMAGKLVEVDAADYVVMCPDWDNEVGPLFGVDDSNKTAAVVVLDAQGVVVGVATEGDLAEQVLAWLA